MNYTICLANNIRTLQPDLAEKTVIEAAEPLTPREIASRVGIHPLLLAAAIINGEVHPLDRPVEVDAEIILMGPIAGG